MSTAGEYFDDTLAAASPDLLRTMIREFAQWMMDAEVEQICGAGYGEVTAERVNIRNGYRAQPWGTRAGSIELAVPRLPSSTRWSSSSGPGRWMPARTCSCGSTPSRRRCARAAGQ
ncbi:transposase [Streptosporangium canum]|uniref:transposase n=1 Tax=Streptosporangium canum TaxID=324952 RepID=UPI0036C993C6